MLKARGFPGCRFFTVPWSLAFAYHIMKLTRLKRGGWEAYLILEVQSEIETLPWWVLEGVQPLAHSLSTYSHPTDHKMQFCLLWVKPCWEPHQSVQYRLGSQNLACNPAGQDLMVRPDRCPRCVQRRLPEWTPHNSREAKPHAASQPPASARGTGISDEIGSLQLL